MSILSPLQLISAVPLISLPLFSPYRIGDDIGSAFAMGLVGGSIFHSFGGYRSAAKGQKVVGLAFFCQQTFTMCQTKVYRSRC